MSCAGVCLTCPRHPTTRCPQPQCSPSSSAPRDVGSARSSRHGGHVPLTGGPAALTGCTVLSHSTATSRAPGEGLQVKQLSKCPEISFVFFLFILSEVEAGSSKASRFQPGSQELTLPAARRSPAPGHITGRLSGSLSASLAGGSQIIAGSRTAPQHPQQRDRHHAQSWTLSPLCATSASFLRRETKAQEPRGLCLKARKALLGAARGCAQNGTAVIAALRGREDGVKAPALPAFSSLNSKHTIGGNGKCPYGNRTRCSALQQPMQSAWSGGTKCFNRGLPEPRPAAAPHCHPAHPRAPAQLQALNGHFLPLAIILTS